jgi:hypothetical protein
MPDRYIIHGATNCGNGAASNEAASPGAAGAWNNINILTGTAPTNTTNIPTAGDTIYIRSKSSAGADITVDASAGPTINSGTPTAAAPITWILDNGAVWTDINGVLKYTTATQTAKVTVGSFNHVIARTQDALIFENTATTGTSVNTVAIINAGAVVENALFDCSAKTAGSGRNTLQNSGILINPHFKFGYTSTTVGGWLTTGADDLGVFVNPNIESVVSQPGPLLLAGGDNQTLSIYGGQITGTGADAGMPLFVTSISNAGGRYKMIGFNYPNTLTVPNPTGSKSQTLEAYGIDGKQGSLLWEVWGWASSRSDNNPPYLNATLPDSAATPWAWRVYPVAATIAAQMILPLAKTYTDTAAAKTITLEMLVATTYTGLDKSDLWIDVSYIDHTTGDSKFVTSRLLTATALDTSTAGWSSTSWGLVTFDKRKLSVTTPTSIKQDTPVIVTLRGTKASVGVGDILFVCPDVQLS